MTIPFDDWVEGEYERIVANAGLAAIKRDNVIDQITQNIGLAIQRGDVARPSELSLLVRQVVVRGDDKRRRQQPEDIHYLVDVVSGLTILGNDNPWLDKVAVVGGGVRKAWRYVNTDDLYEMAARKTQHAADAAIAANDFMKNVRCVAPFMLNTYGPSAVVGDMLHITAGP